MLLVLLNHHPHYTNTEKFRYHDYLAISVINLLAHVVEAIAQSVNIATFLSVVRFGLALPASGKALLLV